MLLPGRCGCLKRRPLLARTYFKRLPGCSHPKRGLVQPAVTETPHRTAAGPGAALPVAPDQHWHRHQPGDRVFPASPCLIGNDFLPRDSSGNDPLYQIDVLDMAWRITGRSCCSIRWFVLLLYYFSSKSMKEASYGVVDGVESDTPWLCLADPGAVFSAQWQNAYL